MVPTNMTREDKRDNKTHRVGNQHEILKGLEHKLTHKPAELPVSIWVIFKTRQALVGGPCTTIQLDGRHDIHLCKKRGIYLVYDNLDIGLRGRP